MCFNSLSTLSCRTLSNFLPPLFLLFSSSWLCHNIFFQYSFMPHIYTSCAAVTFSSQLTTFSHSIFASSWLFNIHYNSIPFCCSFLHLCLSPFLYLLPWSLLPSLQSSLLSLFCSEAVKIFFEMSCGEREWNSFQDQSVQLSYELHFFDCFPFTCCSFFSFYASVRSPSSHATCAHLAERSQPHDIRESRENSPPSMPCTRTSTRAAKNLTDVDLDPDLFFTLSRNFFFFVKKKSLHLPRLLILSLRSLHTNNFFRNYASRNQPQVGTKLLVRKKRSNLTLCSLSQLLKHEFVWLFNALSWK